MMKISVAVFVLVCVVAPLLALEETRCIVFDDPVYPSSPPPLELQFDGCDVVLRRDGVELIRVTRAPIEVIRGSEERPEEYRYDQVDLVGGCLVVRRRVHVLGAFCHTPRAERVEIVPKEGRPRVVVDEGTVAALSGLLVIDHPSGAWGLILRESEAMVAPEFAIVRATGEVLVSQLRERTEGGWWIDEPAGACAPRGDAIACSARFLSVQADGSSSQEPGTVLIRVDGSLERAREHDRGSRLGRDR